MQRMRQQKLSCILASVKVSLLSQAVVALFLFPPSLSNYCKALECWEVGVGPAHVQWHLIKPNTQCKIIKCVFTCCAWLGRRDKNSEHTATHFKYLSLSTSKIHINESRAVAFLYKCWVLFLSCLFSFFFFFGFLSNVFPNKKQTCAYFPGTNQISLDTSKDIR